jgi:hypothetical protein
MMPKLVIPAVDEFGLSTDRAAYDSEYYDAWLAVLHERDAAGAEYAAMALWDRKPVDEQGSMTASARRLRAAKKDAAAQRWLELESRADRMTRAEYARKCEQDK